MEQEKKITLTFKLAGQSDKLLNEILGVEEKFKGFFSSSVSHKRLKKEKLHNFPDVKKKWIKSHTYDGKFNINTISKMSYMNKKYLSSNKNYKDFNVSVLRDMINIFNWSEFSTAFPEIKKGKGKIKFGNLLSATLFILSLRNILAHKSNEPIKQIKIFPKFQIVKKWKTKQVDFEIKEISDLINLAIKINKSLKYLKNKIEKLNQK